MIADPGDLLLVERVRARSPGAVELARLASLAVTIEPQLLRSLRLSLLPHLGVTSEVDLWLSPLVEARSREGIVLHPSVAHHLRRELQAEVPAATIAEAWDWIRRHHTALSPAIQREEELAWWALEGRSADIDEGLRAALRTMVEQPDRNLSAWWVRARDRLPAEVLNSDVAASLDQRSVAASLSPPTATHGSEPGAADDRVLHVRLRHRGLEIGYFTADGSTVGVVVPALEPTRVEIEWVGSDEAPARVVVPAGGSVVVPLKTPTARLKTERGELYDVALDSAPPTEAEVLLLAELFAAVGLAVLQEWPDAEIGLAIGGWVEEYIDPLWRRALRSVGPALGLPPDATFSTFARAAIEAALGAAKPGDRGLANLARRLADRLPDYDDWDRSSPPRSPEWRSTVDLARRFRGRFESVIDERHELRRLGQWIEHQVCPPWMHPGSPSLPDQIRDEVHWPREVHGPYGQVVSGPVTPASLDYLRRLWPDLEVMARLDGDRFRLVSDGRVAYDLGRWLGDVIEHSIRGLVIARSTPVGRMVTVGVDAEFARVSDAVDAAGPGGIVQVRPGTYHEHVRLRRDQQLVGPEPGEGEAIIDGDGTGAVVRTADGCAVRNLTIRNGGEATGVEDCGVLVEDCSNVVVDHCHIAENGHYGMILRRCEAVIEHNTIRANAILGIYADEGARATMRFNLFLDHRHSALDVIAIEGSFANCTVIRCGDSIYYGHHEGRIPLAITRNIFVGNASAIHAVPGTFETIEHNLFHGNEHTYWDWSRSIEVEVGSTNLVADPDFVDPEDGDYRLGPDSPARAAAPDGAFLGALAPAPSPDRRRPPVQPPDGDPTRDLVVGSFPFVNREVLRQHVREMLNDDPGTPRVLVVNGPAGSGRSITWRFIAHVARARSQEAHRVEVALGNEVMSDEAVSAEITALLRLPRPVDVDVGTRSGATEWARAVALAVREPTWLVVDAELAPVAVPSDVNLIGALVSATAQGPTGLRLVVIGIEPKALPPVPLLVEEIGPIGESSVRLWLEQYLEQTSGVTDPKMLDELVASVLAELPTGPDWLRSLSPRLQSLLTATATA